MAPKQARRAALSFIFVTVMLDVLALGIIIPVLPMLVVEFTGGEVAQGAQIYGIFGTVWAGVQFFAAPFLGALSDRFGRRPVILLSNLGLALDYVLMALAPNLYWLFVGRVLSGLTASSIPTAGAYISDVLPPEKRAGGFGLLGAAFGLGFVLGPAVGGLLGHTDPRLPFWAAAGLSFINTAYGFFVLPESLPHSSRSKFEWKKANPAGSLKLLRSSPGLMGLGVVWFLSSLSHEVLPSVAVLYTTFRYGWSAKDVGLLLAGVGICSALVQSVVVRAFVSRFGERAALVSGFVFGLTGFAIYGWAETGFLYCLAVPFMAMWGLSTPAAQGLMSQIVNVKEQGQLQGALGSLRGVAGLAGPGIFTVTFSYFISRADPRIPGAPFYLSAGLLLLAGILSWRVTRPRALRVKAYSQTN